MSDSSEKVEIIDLRPAGQRPKGYTSTEIHFEREDVIEAVTLISRLTQAVASTHGEDKAVKDLMLGIDGSAIALCQFTTGEQVVNILEQAIKRVREFDGLLAKVKAAEAAAASGTRH